MHDSLCVDKDLCLELIKLVADGLLDHCLRIDEAREPLHMRLMDAFERFGPSESLSLHLHMR